MIKADAGWGFIRGENRMDYFFHRSQLIDYKFEDLRKDQPVEFEPGDGEKGPRAEQISVTGS
jgi:CspA family cold shock protein